MKRLLILLYIVSFLLIGWSAFSQSVTLTGFVGKFSFQSFSAGGSSDVTGTLDAFSDQTNQYFASNIEVGDMVWDNQGNRWEVMAVNSSNLLQADVDLRSVNGAGGTPLGIGFVSRETPNMGLSLFVPDNNIGISQQLKSRIESHNMLLIDQYIGESRDSVFTGATAADTTAVSDPTIGDVLVADNGDVGYYDGTSWVVSSGGGASTWLKPELEADDVTINTGLNLLTLDDSFVGLGRSKFYAYSWLLENGANDSRLAFAPSDISIITPGALTQIRTDYIRAQNLNYARLGNYYLDTDQDTTGLEGYKLGLEYGKIKLLPDNTGAGADNLGNHTMTQNLRTQGNFISFNGSNSGIFVDPEGRVGINTDQVMPYRLNVAGDIANDSMIRPGVGVKNDLIYLAPAENEIQNFWYSGFYVLLHVAPPYVDGYGKDYANGTLYIKPTQFEEDFYAIDVQTFVDGVESSLKGTINVRTMNGKYDIALVKANYQGNTYAAIYFYNPSNSQPPEEAFFSGIVSSNPPTSGFESPMTIVSADNAFADQYLARPEAITDQDIIAHDYAYENRFRRVAVGITSGGGSAVLDVSGDTRLRNELRDVNNEAGTPGQILSTTGVGIDWIDAPAGGAADGNGIYSGSGNVPDATEATLADGGSFTIKDNSGADRLRITEEANIAITATTGFTATTTSGILGLTHTGSSGHLIVQSQDERATFQGEEARVIGDTLARMTVGTGDVLVKNDLVDLTAGSSDFATLDGSINEFRVGTHDIVFEGTDGFYPEWKFETPVAANDWRMWTGGVGLTLQNGSGENTIVIANGADPALSIAADGLLRGVVYTNARHDTDNVQGNYSVGDNGDFLKTYDGEFNYEDSVETSTDNTNTVIVNNGTTTLPVAVGNAGKMFIVIANASTTGGTTRTINVASSGTIEGNASLTMDNAYEVYALISTGTEYVILWNKP